MYTGVIIDNSLTDPQVLSNFKILKTWETTNWKLHKVFLSKEDINTLSKSLNNGPGYAHFWKNNKDDILVTDKNKIFPCKFSHKETWEKAISYGLSINIPREQLIFLIDQDL